MPLQSFEMLVQYMGIEQGLLGQRRRGRFDAGCEAFRRSHAFRGREGTDGLGAAPGAPPALAVPAEDRRG